MIGINDTRGEGAFFMLILITFYLFSGYCFVYSRAKIQQKRMKSFASKRHGFWRSDLLMVNGYDENMIGWGREDSASCFRKERMLRSALICFQVTRFRNKGNHFI